MWVGTSFGVIDTMRAVASPGLTALDAASISQLRRLTRELITLRAVEARQEESRFRAIADRTLALPGSRLSAATVLVTGGTGCVGSALINELAAAMPKARVVSVSRGITQAWPRNDQASYLSADITDRAAMDAIMNTVGPDIVFHVAGQRDPGLAEGDVRSTVTTNILGTRNVLAAAANSGVSRTILASTGKAMRLYSPDIYAASKRAAEWIAAGTAAESSMLCSAARFTHVVDNSIVYRRVTNWAAQPDGVIRLHAPDAAFYVQSALESARLLLFAGLNATEGQLTIHAITDLGWPVSLLDLAIGVLERTGSDTPVYFSGYDRGYEAAPFPGLYDPATSGDVSPLLNGVEAATATSHGNIDTFPMPTAPGVPDLIDEFTAGPTRAALSELSWSLLDATIRNAPRPARDRIVKLTRGQAVTPDHQRILEALKLVEALK
jgi:FlaA1/EpsC-like NDP-sugar epimerase